MALNWHGSRLHLGRYVAGSVLIFLYVLAGCSALAPSESEPEQSPPLQTATLPNFPATQPTDIPNAELKEQRLVLIEWPEKIRLGDGDIVRLTLEVDETGVVTPTAEIEGHQVTGTPVEIPDLYETHNLVVEARLDLAGAAVSPPQGTIQEPLRRGQVLHFYWSIQTQQIGRTRGTLWLFLNLIPKDEGEPDRKALLSKQLEIETVSVLGLPANLARWTGAIGTAFSVVLGFPFLESLIAGLWKRLAAARERRV